MLKSTLSVNKRPKGSLSTISTSIKRLISLLIKKHGSHICEISQTIKQEAKRL